ncbi:MAG: hypothetical protein M3R70_01315 [Actinomycetota bacterium]|nr:hypothetical protein [Actinomycetota bacterium]
MQRWIRQLSGPSDRGAGDRAGLTVKEISEGPFKGTWYIEKYAAEVKRAPLISKDLYPSSDLYTKNSGTRRSDFVALGSSVGDHENLHGALMSESLKTSDPAKKIEKMVGSDGDPLGTEVNVELMNLESAFEAATAEANVKARMRLTGAGPQPSTSATGVGGFMLRTFPSPPRSATERGSCHRLERGPPVYCSGHSRRQRS